MTQASLGELLHGSHVVRAAELARLDQRRSIGILLQTSQAALHRIAREPARQFKDVTGIVSAARCQIGEFKKLLDVFARSDLVEVTESHGRVGG